MLGTQSYTCQCTRDDTSCPRENFNRCYSSTYWTKAKGLEGVWLVTVMNLSNWRSMQTPKLIFFSVWHSHLISICTPAQDQVVSGTVGNTKEVGGNQLVLLEAAACFWNLHELLWVHFCIYLQSLTIMKVKFCMHSLHFRRMLLLQCFDEATDALSIPESWRLHEKKHSQQVKGGDSAPLLRSRETPPGVLPREAVASPSLAVFKARLDGALSNLV